MGLRIALTSAHCWPEVHRGAERYVHELSRALVGAGHQVVVLSTGRPSRSLVLGVPVRRFPPGPPTRFGQQALRRLAVARLDVWHATSTHDAVSAVRLGAHRPRLRTVFTDHGFPVRASRERRGEGEEHQQVVERIGSYVCVSEAAAHWLEKDYGRVADVVPPGVDTDAFTPGGPRSPQPTVLYSGSLDEERKGVRLLVEAVALLPGVRLRLAGPGAADLSGIATDHVDLVGLAGPEELRDLYRSSWVTALPSTAEAFGMSLVESLACGTPGVARADGGGPTEILVDGTGRLCEGSAPALAAALQQAMATADPAACRARAEAFDWRRVVVPALEHRYAA